MTNIAKSPIPPPPAPRIFWTARASMKASRRRSAISSISMPPPRASAGRPRRFWRPRSRWPRRRRPQGQKRGVLFGPERTGLDNDEVALADAILTFPANPAYASLNLAQAVLLVGYEWFKSAHGDAPPPQTVPRPVSPPADREMVIAFFEFLEDKLDAAGFFRPVTKKPGMRRNLRNIFHRMQMTQQDVRTLWGAVVRLVEGPRAEVQTRKRIRPKKAGGEDAAPEA